MQKLEQKFLKGYKLEERIGAGGFGAVYRARQSTIDREVAIKIILPNFANNPDFIRRFESEAYTIARLEHPHITPLIDYWRDPEGAYLVMRYLRGGSIRQALEDGPYEPLAASQTLDQIASALDFAHRNQVIHRDIKPSNILLDEDGNAYLADFGIAKDLTGSDDGLTDDNVIVGSLDYISPEQARNEPATPRTDIYSLGVTLYEMLTGEHPFKQTSSIERFYKHINDPLPEITTLPDSIGGAVNKVIRKATAKNPDQRYPEALALAVAFRQAVGRDSQPSSLVEQLTLREQEILAMIIQGMSNRDIANQLVVTVGTVKWHIRQVYGKLGVRSRVQAIVRARELNLILPGEQAPGSLPQTNNDSGLDRLPEPENPYKGLHAFQSIDAHDFFGREDLIQKLIDHLCDQHDFHRFMAVIGPSGSGKSSLVRAGLIPALWRGALHGSDKWFIADMIPSAYPLDKLETALIRVAANQSSNIHEQLRRDVRGLLRVADIILPGDDTELVIVVDQFEEVFTLVADEAECQHFLDLIQVAVSDVRSRVRVIVTLRADYYDRPLHYPEFGELIRSRMETVLPLSASGLERAIRAPAERVGVTFEQGLVEQIVSTMNYQAGALPLLQYALTELFDRRQGRVITVDAYQQIGGAVGALAHRADEIYLSLTPEGQKLAHQMFMRLVTLGEGAEDTRRRTTQAELRSLTENTDLMEEVIEQFAAYRLLSLDHDPQTRQPTVEVAHEAILREWDRLRGWINDSRTELRLQLQLAGLVIEWHKANEETSYLLHGARLEQFEAWAESTRITLTPRERAYLQASLDERRRQEAAEQSRQARELDLEHRAKRTFQTLTVVLFIAALGGFGLAALAFDREQHAEIARQEAQTERDRAQELALINGARAAFASQDSDTALALATVANQREDSSSAARLILSQAAYPPGTARIVGRGVDFFRVDVSPDGRYALSGSTSGSGLITLWDIVSGEVVRSLEGHTGIINDVAFSRDGKTAFSTATDAALIIWNLETGDIIHRLGEDQIHGGTALRAAFSPDSKSILSTNNGRSQQSPDAEAKLILWDVETGEMLRVFRGHTTVVGELAISPDGRTALSGGWGEELILWDMETGEVIRRRTELSDRPWRIPTGITFRPDGLTAVVTFADTTAILVELATLETLHEFGSTAPGNSWWTQIALSPDGRRLYLHEAWAIFDVDTGQQLLAFPRIDRTFGAAFLPDGKSLLLGSNELRLYALEHGAEIQRMALPLFWYELSPDDRTILTSWSQPPDLITCAFVALDVSTGAEIRRFDQGSALIDDLGCAILSTIDFYAISPDSQTVLAGASGGHVTLWDFTSGAILRRFEGDSHWVSSVAFSPDGQFALTGGCTQPDTGMLCPAAEIILWDVAAGAEVRRMIPPVSGGMIHRVMFSADGDRALSAHRGGLAIVWDVATGDIIQQFAPTAGIVRDAVFSPDGTQVLTSSAGSGPVILWDITTGEELLSLAVSLVSGLEFSPDGRFVVMTGARLSLWDMATGEEIRRYAESGQQFWVAPVIRSDGTGFFGYATADSIREFRIDNEHELLAWTLANRHVRDLTCVERETYRITPYCER